MNWRPGVIIRHKQTGKPLKVLHSYAGATVVVDLEDGRNPTPSSILLERDYTNWIDEKKLNCQVEQKNDEPVLHWGVVAI